MKNSFQIESKDVGKRIDQYLSDVVIDKSRAALQKLIKEDNVTVNDKIIKANYKLNEGDIIVVDFPASTEISLEPENIPLDILFEDEDVIIINKPKGMVVHPAPGHYSGTLVNAILYHCKGALPGINGELRPGIVHRIDRNTTGSIIVCKTELALNGLAAQFKAHSINREYVAIVHGNIKEDDGTIKTMLGRHPIDRKKMSVNTKNGRAAITHYTVLERFGNFTAISCKLETGRTHQIRVHMSSIGHPILGDDLYGPKKPAEKNLIGQTLHAKVLGFVHPRTGEYIEVEVPLPTYFENLLNKYRQK